MRETHDTLLVSWSPSAIDIKHEKELLRSCSCKKQQKQELLLKILMC